MKEDQAAQILLVQTVEECDESAFSEDDFQNAIVQAGAHIGGGKWLSQRAAYLIARLPPAYRMILQMIKFPGRFFPLISILAFVTGIATNYLGPTGKIHVFFNSIMVLIAWNLLLYLFLIFSRVYQLMRPSKRPKEDKRQMQASYEPQLEQESQDSSQLISRLSRTKLSWMIRAFFPTVWTAMQRLTGVTLGVKVRMAAFGKVAAKFWTQWCAAAESLLIARWRRMLHFCSIWLTLGAILGIYSRGLFFEYNVVWASTFIRNEEVIAVMIRIFTEPALILAGFLGQNIAVDSNVPALMGQTGVPAAPWIHLYFLIALAVIIIPRVLLAMWETIRIVALGRTIHINIDRKFIEKIDRQLAKIIQHEVLATGDTLSDEMATFVCEKLYDDLIVPQLKTFREKGGKIAELKNHISQTCEGFGAEMKSHIVDAMSDFEQSLVVSIGRIVSSIQAEIGLEKGHGADWSNVIEERTGGVVQQSVEPIGNRFANTVGAAVAGSTAVVVGTFAGGFGEVLGVAIIAELLAVGGPVGFIIGALVGLVIAAGGWWLGRDKITETIENVHCPGWLLRRFLWTSKYEKIIKEGREKTYESVKRQATEKMSPLLPKIADEILEKIQNLWNY
jgi:hypothetical protein